jgi:MFS superfamily sulfate permease-like transporter
MFYRAGFLPGDVVAGLSLAAIAIPTQMATSRLGGFSPQFGFFAFVAASLAFAMFGGSRFLSSGSDSTITPIFAGSLAQMASTGSADYLALTAALALMVGVWLVLGGVFRLGWIADLLSIPVTTGFFAGIAVHIFVSQLPAVLGVPTPKGTMLSGLSTLLGQIGDANPYTVVIGLGVLAAIAGTTLIDRRIPGALIGLIAATAAVVLGGLESHGVAVLGDVSGVLPLPGLPHLAVSRLADLVPLSLLIAVVVMVQTAATTRSFPSDPDEPPDVDRDFIGVGAGSILSGLVGAFPVDASPPCTTIVAETGGRSQLACLVAAVIVIALVAFGTVLLRHVPTAALGGVLFFVAFRIVRLRQIVAVWRQSLGEFLLIVATAAAIVVLPIAQGVGIGIALSLLHGIWSTTRARVIMFERLPGTTIWWPQSPHIAGEREPNIIVVGFPAPLTFLNAYDFRGGMRDALQSSEHKARLVVLEATGIVEIDFTAAQALRDVIREYHDAGTAFAIARLESERAQDAITRFHIDELLGSDRIFRSVEEAIRTFCAGKIPGFKL